MLFRLKVFLSLFKRKPKQVERGRKHFTFVKCNLTEEEAKAFLDGDKPMSELPKDAFETKGVYL